MNSTASPAFLYVICQVGVERLCKERMAAQYPDTRFAYSRPGFLTFKIPEGTEPQSYDLQNAFARTWGVSLGRFDAESHEAGAERFWQEFDASCGYVHVWQRDSGPVGGNFEPLLSETAAAAADAIRSKRPAMENPPQVNGIAPMGAKVFDCILVEPNQWWIGTHHATSVERSWVGGTPRLKPPENMISRAYLKMHEAIAWSRLPYHQGDECVEIGCAPGGASQAMLEHGLKVMGVDPADVSPLLEANENFRHVKKRGRDVRRKEFAAARWLMSDTNVTPVQMLDTVEDIVTNDRVNLRGMLLTLKMPDWKLVADLPGYLDRIRGWGFRYVRPRHLAFNRQELCVAAFRNKSVRRFG